MTVPKTTTKSYIYIAVTLIAALTAGCSESQEEKVYQTFKCAKAATMLGEDADAQIAMRNTDHLLSKINTGGSPARYGMEMGARFQEEVPLYANDREGQFQLLLEVYKSSRCKALYRQQSAPSGQTGIPEHMPGEMPLPAGGAASDAPVEQEGDRPLESLRASASDVVIDPPILGSEADHNRNEVIRPTHGSHLQERAFDAEIIDIATSSATTVWRWSLHSGTGNRSASVLSRAASPASLHIARSRSETAVAQPGPGDDRSGADCAGSVTVNVTARIVCPSSCTSTL